jgi:hypothetical protein
LSLRLTSIPGEFLMLTSVTTLLILACAGLDIPPERKEPPANGELAAITERGKLLAAYDAAAWHASDALMAKNPPQGGVGRYIARKLEASWVVVFGRLDDKRDVFLIAYEAMQSKAPEVFEVKRFDPPKADKGLFRSAAKAFDLVQKDFVKGFQGEQRPYNVALLPADKDQLWVYLVPAPTKPGVWPLGGDVRYLVSANGTKIVEKRQLHSAIIELEPPKQDDPNKLAMGIHTHVLDDTPEDTDVFHVLSRKPSVPELVVTKQFVFQVGVDGEIKYLGKADEFLKKK